jgi:unsaturated chondroitin disaccharide hydrolase
MMNLPLLWWASEETGDPRYRNIAMAHADMAMKCFVREDGSVNHIVEFDPNTGAFVKSHGGQGYGEGSSWTRGQAWALYGFTLNYMLAQKCGIAKREYLETANRVSRYFMDNIPESGLIPVDFRQPAEPALEDSTAAAIAACGLLKLSTLCNCSERNDAAAKLLRALLEKRCDWSEANDCILTHCTEAYHNEKGRHINMVYADYFLIEALLYAHKNTFSLWCEK